MNPLKPVSASLPALALFGCAAVEPVDANHREVRETMTGSNIPRRDPQSMPDAKILGKDAIEDLIHSNGPRGKWGN
ncbi:MAG TPA: hypothetical protein VF308_00705 [Caldimonas sp.]